MNKSIQISIAFLFIGLAGIVHSQVTSGMIQGQISDAQGGLILSAMVTATNTGTAVKSVTQSNETGFYLFPRLAPGNYRVEIEAAGCYFCGSGPAPKLTRDDSYLANCKNCGVEYKMSATAWASECDSPEYVLRWVREQMAAGIRPVPINSADLKR